MASSSNSPLREKSASQKPITSALEHPTIETSRNDVGPQLYNHASSRPCPTFNGLPAEIRVMIWKFTLSPAQDIVPYKKRDISILFLNRTSYAEVLPLIYDTVDLSMTVLEDSLEFLSMIGSRGRRAVRNLVLPYKDDVSVRSFRSFSGSPSSPEVQLLEAVLGYREFKKAAGGRLAVISFGSVDTNKEIVKFAEEVFDPCCEDLPYLESLFWLLNARFKLRLLGFKSLEEGENLEDAACLGVFGWEVQEWRETVEMEMLGGGLYYVTISRI